MKRLLLSLIIFDILVAYSFALRVDVVAALSLLVAGVLFGVLGSVIAARRLYFLAGAAPHSALFSALISVVAAYWLGIGVLSLYSLYALSILIGIVVVYVAGYLIFRGVDPDLATSILVAFASSFSVITAYYIKTSLPVPFDIMSIVFGDPLLVTSKELIVAIIVAALVVLGLLLSYPAQIYLGVDRDSAMLTGAPIWLYDLVFFTLLGATVVALIRVIGFVLEHILLLLPGALAASHGRSSEEALLVSLASALTASALGMLISMAVPVSPSGAVGVSMLLIYAFALLYKR